MTLDQAKEIARAVAESGHVTTVSPKDAASAMVVLLEQCEVLGAVVSDAETLLQRFRASSGNEYFIDVRGKDLAAVLGRAT